MGPAPQLSDYQAAAQSIYAPQQQAEQTSLQATEQTTINTLEAEKPQVQTDYQSAIDTLTNSVQDQTAKIQQLYTNNLSGNFSGLEGNDMGELFSRANQQEGIIASTEANKLAAITTEEGNAQITYNADVSALTPKYMALESQYAQSAYGSAVTAYNTANYRNEQLSLDYAKLGVSAGNAATSAENATAAEYKATGKPTVGATGAGSSSTSNGYDFTGPNGTPINLNTYLTGSGGGNVNIGQLSSILQNGSAYDKAIYNASVNKSTGLVNLQTVANLDAKGATVGGKKIGGANAYGF